MQRNPYAPSLLTLERAFEVYEANGLDDAPTELASHIFHATIEKLIEQAASKAWEAAQANPTAENPYGPDLARERLVEKLTAIARTSANIDGNVNWKARPSTVPLLTATLSIEIGPDLAPDLRTVEGEAKRATTGPWRERVEDLADYVEDMRDIERIRQVIRARAEELGPDDSDLAAALAVTAAKEVRTSLGDEHADEIQLEWLFIKAARKTNNTSALETISDLASQYLRAS